MVIRLAEVRADTHRDNVIMQHILEKNGFVKCGTIVWRTGCPGLHTQKCPLIKQDEKVLYLRYRR